MLAWFQIYVQVAVAIVWTRWAYEDCRLGLTDYLDVLLWPLAVVASFVRKGVPY